MIIATRTRLVYVTTKTYSSDMILQDLHKVKQLEVIFISNTPSSTSACKFHNYVVIFGPFANFFVKCQG